MTEEQQLLDKWKDHNLIQEAIAHAHTNPSPQTLQAIENINKSLEQSKIHMDKVTDRLEGKIDSLTEKIETFLLASASDKSETKLNIENLKETVKETKKVTDDNIIEIDRLKQWRTALAWGLGLLVSIGGTIFLKKG